MCNIPDDFHYSFSKLDSIEKCPMMFKLEYLDGVEGLDNAYAQYGTLCHSILEQWAKGELMDFMLADEYASRYDNEVNIPFPPFPAGLGQKMYEAGLSYFEGFDGFGDKYEVLAVEEKFSINIEGYTVTGIADLVLRNTETDEIEIIDHKSKSLKTMKKDLPVYRNQLYIYAMWCKEKFGKYPTKIKFNMFREGNNVFVEENFTSDGLANAKTWILDRIHEINTTEEWRVSPSSYFCRYICGCSERCEAYQAIRQEELRKWQEKKDMEALSDATE